MNKKTIQQIKNLDWELISLIITLAIFGIILLYSASYGDVKKLVIPHLSKLILGLILMISVAIIDIKFWFRLSFLFYILALLLLISVYFFGSSGKGAVRWLNFGFINIQPSEIMKIAAILLISKICANMSYSESKSIKSFFIASIIAIPPTLLILNQPDLGTASLLFIGCISIPVLAGLSYKWIFSFIAFISVSTPLIWQFVLLEYQKKRIAIFLNPELDPLNSGYHTIQSKIAIGSGGLFGHGYMQGTQSQLNFLPEKHTDFIFTLLAEEFGIFGGITLLTLVFLILIKIYKISIKTKSKFAKLLTGGVGVTFFLYVFINIAMVTGMFPIVGVPIPLVSYGGTVMITMLCAFGLVLNADLYKDKKHME